MLLAIHELKLELNRQYGENEEEAFAAKEVLVFTENQQRKKSLASTPATATQGMNYLGIDYGEKRIGLSFGDGEVCLAVPIAAAVEPTLEARLQHIRSEIQQRRVAELVVGYPYNMDGTVGFKALEVDAFIETLTREFGLPVHRTDERLTSSDAQARMKSAGGKGKRGSNAKQASIQARLAERRSGTLDSRAAALILQDYLDTLPRRGMELLFPEGDDDFADYADDDASDTPASAYESAAAGHSGQADYDNGNSHGDDTGGDHDGHDDRYDANGDAGGSDFSARDFSDNDFDGGDDGDRSGGSRRKSGHRHQRDGKRRQR